MSRIQPHTITSPAMALLHKVSSYKWHALALFLGAIPIVYGYSYIKENWYWSGPRNSRHGTVSRTPGGESETTMRVARLDRTWVTVNPRGQCIIKWQFDGLIEVANSLGEIRAGVTTHTRDESFWPEKVRSATGEPVEFHYWLSC